MSTSKPSLKALASLAVALAGAAVAMIFFVAPEDADQGISQKIFYFHVPIALTAYACFGLGAWKALAAAADARGAIRPRELHGRSTRGRSSGR